MSSDKRIEMVKKLLQKTNKGVIGWEDTSDENKFQAMISNHIIQVSLEDEKGKPLGVQIDILNNKGEIIDNFICKENAGSIYRDTFYPMFEKARGYARGTEQALDEILNVLNDDDVPF